jgi:hypothetical protein
VQELHGRGNNESPRRNGLCAGTCCRYAAYGVETAGGTRIALVTPGCRYKEQPTNNNRIMSEMNNSVIPVTLTACACAAAPKPQPAACPAPQPQAQPAVAPAPAATKGNKRNQRKR